MLMYIKVTLDIIVTGSSQVRWDVGNRVLISEMGLRLGCLISEIGLRLETLRYDYC